MIAAKSSEVNPLGTELAQACTATIRIKLLKIGAAVVRNTRRGGCC